MGVRLPGAPINGQLRWGSLEALFDYLVENCDLDEFSWFFDLGAWRGKPILYATMRGVAWLLGVECSRLQCWLSMAVTKRALEAAKHLGIDMSHSKLWYLHCEIESSNIVNFNGLACAFGYYHAAICAGNDPWRDQRVGGQNIFRVL